MLEYSLEVSTRPRKRIKKKKHSTGLEPSEEPKKTLEFVQKLSTPDTRLDEAQRKKIKTWRYPSITYLDRLTVRFVLT